jgi:DNA helicase-2/ATP-dependent DNA helicase PcrA
VIGRCETLFANVSGDTSNFVLLSSVHRAKGLEADVVHVIRPDQMPHPMARGPEAQAQEQNLIYVAYTRARRELHIH